MFVLRVALLLAVTCLLTRVESRIQLLDPHTQHSKGSSSTMHDLKGRLMLPLRSEAGRYGDSTTYFVQLPSSQNYYSQLTSHVPFTPGTTHLRRILPVNFASNGRPARVYHWNMPLLRRMQQQQQLQARRHSPIHSEIFADDVTPSPKSRRVNKKAGLLKSKTESPIYRIMPLEKQQQQTISIKSKSRSQNVH
ncbi:hypothetical protein B566_EDAN013823 [Ephemera danica]|nr:hypothetical protein B566_EDAN013823 [Ephemera danica]